MRASCMTCVTLGTSVADMDRFSLPAIIMNLICMDEADCMIDLDFKEQVTQCCKAHNELETAFENVRMQGACLHDIREQCSQSGFLYKDGRHIVIFESRLHTNNNCVIHLPVVV